MVDPVGTWCARCRPAVATAHARRNLPLAVVTAAPADAARRTLLDHLVKVGATALAAAMGGGAVIEMISATPASAATAGATTRKYRYGMVIDTRRCVGCKACVVACKAENKTPPGVSYTVVVTRPWNRPDDKPLFMTKPCFHCENPPCVDVCPVAATYKRSQDGIVVVDYDRCIGCRYCITGCPYGARYFDFGENYPPSRPDTAYRAGSIAGVRAVPQSREPSKSPIGNVRKCTFCVHLQDDERPLRQGGRALARLREDLHRPRDPLRRLQRSRERGLAPPRERQAIRLKEELGTEPNVYYLL